MKKKLNMKKKLTKEEVEELLERGRKLLDDPTTHLSKGMAYWKLKRYNEAINEFLIAEKMNPEILNNLDDPKIKHVLAGYKLLTNLDPSIKNAAQKHKLITFSSLQLGAPGGSGLRLITLMKSDGKIVKIVFGNKGKELERQMEMVSRNPF